MKVLVLGGNGMLGHMLVRELGRSSEVYTTVRGRETILARAGICNPDRIVNSVDVTEYETVERALEAVEPDVVINAIGVIKQREQSKDVPLTIEVNSLLPHRLAASSTEIGARFITFSTDCVFSGDRGHYGEDDLTDATDLYGKSKALGEVDGENRLTLRTSIIGRELTGSRSLVEWVISMREGSIKGFANARYSGFTTLEMSHLVDMLIRDLPEVQGIYNVSSDPISKFELICMINDHLGLGISITRDEEFVIDRSLVSDSFKAVTGYKPKPWDEMIREMAKDAGIYEKWRELRF